MAPSGRQRISRAASAHRVRLRADLRVCRPSSPRARTAQHAGVARSPYAVEAASPRSRSELRLSRSAPSRDERRFSPRPMKGEERRRISVPLLKH
ncbi:hypothetical protein SKAU_G00025670 [Synaphobranchus kaupii]|uniref:Uncharacterized protein n=1 Tax=Synaphobranchus kaupii TaxID=118154 RepID=A0A9Q1GE18_SYNKA|nr:hypothetical protein SKAU_G00025670 [Synaphobranchus kaupii]